MDLKVGKAYRFELSTGASLEAVVRAILHKVPDDPTAPTRVWVQTADGIDHHLVPDAILSATPAR